MTFEQHLILQQVTIYQTNQKVKKTSNINLADIEEAGKKGCASVNTSELKPYKYFNDMF
jgi:hypothetical protein